jgi:hypothetical protein
MSVRTALVSLDRLPGESLSDRGRYRIKAQKADGLMTLIVDPNGGIRGFHIAPLTEPEPPVAHSELPLGLPFKGQWVVLWGGDNYEVNRHVSIEVSDGRLTWAGWAPTA